MKSEAFERAVAAVRANRRQCQLYLNQYAELDEVAPDGGVDEHLDALCSSIVYATRATHRSLRVALELGGLHDSNADFETGLKGMEKAWGSVEYFDEYLGPHTKVTEYLDEWIRVVTPLVKSIKPVEAQRKILENMLRQIPAYLRDKGFKPKGEIGLQKMMLPAFRLSFPDVVLNPKSAKQTKTYIPDFGFSSLNSIVEFKFAKEKNDASKALGEIYEDMKGYSGVFGQTGYGLIYMTGSFLSQQQVDAELADVGAPANWKIYVVSGPSA